MTKRNYYMYKQAASEPTSNYGLLGVLYKLFGLKNKEKQSKPEQVDESALQDPTQPPLPADAWHGGGIGMFP